MAGNSKKKRVSAGTKKKGGVNSRPISVLSNMSPETLAEETRALKLRPALSLEAFRDNVATPTDWRTIQFRIYVGAEIARELYAANTNQGMTDALTAVKSIENRYVLSEGQTLRATAGEIELIRMGLEATDEMQDALNAAQQLAFYKQAQKIIDGTSNKE